VEWEYAAGRYDDFCTVKAPEQQIIYGIAYESLFASAAEIGDSQLEVVAQTTGDNTTNTNTEPKQGQSDASTANVNGARSNEGTSVWLAIIGISLLALVVLGLIAVVVMVVVFTRGRAQSGSTTCTVFNDNGFASKA